MKAIELKIGNLVNYDTAEGDVFTNVIDWQDLKWLSEDEQGFNLVHNPIPLTEEWLLKFGFKEVIVDSWYSKLAKNKNTINISKSGLVAINDDKPIRAIEYVHQLQNLYFALTNEELTLIK